MKTGKLHHGTVCGILAGLSLLCGCQWIGQSVSKMSEWKMPQPPKLFAKKDKTPPPPASRHFNDESRSVASSTESPQGLANDLSRASTEMPSQQEKPTEIVHRPGRATSNTASSTQDKPRDSLQLPDATPQFTKPEVAAFSPDQPPLPRPPYQAPRPSATNSAAPSSAFQPGNDIGGFQARSDHPSSSNDVMSGSTTSFGGGTFGGGSIASRFGSSTTAEPVNSRFAANSQTGSFSSNNLTRPNNSMDGNGSANSSGFGVPSGSNPPTGLLEPRVSSSTGSSAAIAEPSGAPTQTSPQSAPVAEIAPPVRQYLETPFPSFVESPRGGQSSQALNSSGIGGSGFAFSESTSPTVQPVSHNAEIPAELRPKGDTYAPGSLSRLNATTPTNSLWR